MQSPREILEDYWGYPNFRPLQAEIVDAVIAGRDTLALLPTGGGKSICFQVPGLFFEGLTIVISPLIALMRDQVEQLNRRNIPATFINSSLNQHEIDWKLQRTMDGAYKFLYVAPERIQSPMFAARVQRMNVSLIAVDEAHCISQWGYDFRPSYLELQQLREWLPKVPVIAVTATAPPLVRDDIVEKLGLRNPRIFTQSFRRPNLHYQIEPSERIAERIIEICQKTSGTGIVYARTRKRVKAIAEMLQRAQISAAAYHGGMKNSDRNKVQADWIEGKVRVMAATNAFGMGIDKPNVRFVLHFNLPADIESYYQEAGRAGRDGEESLCLAFHNEQDALELRNFTADKYPSWEKLNAHWEGLCEFYGVTLENAPEESYLFDLLAIAKSGNTNPIRLYNSIKILENAGILSLNEQPDDFGYVQVLVSPDSILHYKQSYPNQAFLLDHILRNLGGAAFHEAMRFFPADWLRSLKMDLPELEGFLNQLAAREIIAYTAPSTKPTIKINRHRGRLSKLELNWERQVFLETRAFERLNAMLDYTEYPGKFCRSRTLEAYFGEQAGTECGKCDYCRRRANAVGSAEIRELSTAILAFLGDLELEMRDVVENVQTGTREDRIQMIREMLDKGILLRGDGMRLRRRK